MDGAFHNELTEREQAILRLVVEDFIATAGPIGSRTLARRYDLNLSPATIRNTMADLEAKGFLDHPYTSAGRVPTPLGYRVFVDGLMEASGLPETEQELLRARLRQLLGDRSQLLREASRLLTQLSSLLGVVLTPKLSSGVLERLDIVPLASDRLLFAISVSGGLVNTLVLEAETTINRDALPRVVSVLNERLAGLTLEEVRRTCVQRVRDVQDRTGILRLLLGAADFVFAEPADGRLQRGAAEPLLTQPEFNDADELRRFVRLLEDEETVARMLEDGVAEPASEGRAVVSIGGERDDDEARSYSVVTARYRVGQALGTIGVIGPTRMDYPHAVALVEHLSGLLSDLSADA